MDVAFLGLGTMGAPMAKNVARAGHAVTVWNRTRARMEPLVAAGLRGADDPASAARGADVIITMLADPPALRAVVGAALAGARPGALFVDMSTVDPATIRDLAAEAGARGAKLIDAPVSGSRKPAEEGKLVIMAGGEPADVERARPVLEPMGRLVHLGPTGQGAAMKLVLNGLGAHMLTGYSMALVLAKGLGLDPQRAIDVIQMGAFSSPLFAGKTPKVLARDFSSDFTLALLGKDQALVSAAARSVGLEVPVLEAIRAEIDRAIALGLGGEDLSALVKVFEDRSGIVARR